MSVATISKAFAPLWWGAVAVRVKSGLCKPMRGSLALFLIRIMTVIEQAFDGVNKIHDATPVEGKPGFYNGRLKLYPTITTENGEMIARPLYAQGEYHSFLYEIANHATEPSPQVI